jgi:hypothetical protein
VENHKESNVKLVNDGKLVAIVRVKKIEDAGYDKIELVRVFHS